MNDPASACETAGGVTPAVDYQRGTLRGWPRAVVRWVLLQAIGPFIRLEIDGLEHVPRAGSFLFVANHLHNADPILLEASLKRPVHFMAKKELFRYRPLAWGLRMVGAFPVDRGRSDRAAIRQAEARLASGVPVGMFPEGTRSLTGTLQPAFAGAGLIAIRTRVLIVPASITGSEVLPFNGDKSRRGQWAPFFRRARVAVRIGKPFFLPEAIVGARVSSVAATNLMMAEVARILPAGYRGVYSGRPEHLSDQTMSAASSSSQPSEDTLHTEPA
jgi:1-acyl-sn-glycerol-3-phosphate acyltransferase